MVRGSTSLTELKAGSAAAKSIMMGTNTAATVALFTTLVRRADANTTTTSAKIYGVPLSSGEEMPVSHAVAPDLFNASPSASPAAMAKNMPQLTPFTSSH